VLAALLLVGVTFAPKAFGDEVYLSEEAAPSAVFPEAERFDRSEVRSTPELRAKIVSRLGDTKPSVWETTYKIATAVRGSEPIGRAVIVEEIGKHRAITFVVGAKPDGTIAGVAVMAYREPYGGEVRSPRFTAQYRGKRAADALSPGRDIRNITGATLSARAIGRGVKKALAVLAETPSGAAPSATSGAP
jgi:Na+-translocating ferredoxin:NAD+ oxidoreductase subunit G